MEIVRAGIQIRAGVGILLNGFRKSVVVLIYLFESYTPIVISNENNSKNFSTNHLKIYIRFNAIVFFCYLLHLTQRKHSETASLKTASFTECYHSFCLFYILYFCFFSEPTKWHSLSLIHSLFSLSLHLPCVIVLRVLYESRIQSQSNLSDSEQGKIIKSCA